jgi:MATE family multidrug resistance protein
LAAYLIDGAAYAAESLAGILLGRRDIEVLRRLSRLVLGSGVGFATLALALFFAAPRLFGGLLTSHRDLVALWFGDNHLLWVAMVLFMVARAATLGWVYPGLLRKYAAG